MEINYNIIIDYLYKKENKFLNDVNITQNSNDFNKFKKLFSLSYFRYGIHSKDNNDNNISFWSSLLFCFDDKFITKSISEIEKIISLLKKQIINTDIIIEEYNNNKILSDINNPYFLELICNFFKINLIIFDFKKEIIESAYYNKYFNPFRCTIYLAKYEDLWEPIISNEKKYFNKNNDPDKILSKILIENINYYNLQIKNFTINDDIYSILVDENLLHEVNNSDEDTFISKENLLMNLNFNKLNKMKKNELEKICDDLNLNLDIKRPKKADYINLINTKLNLN